MLCCCCCYSLAATVVAVAAAGDAAVVDAAAAAVVTVAAAAASGKREWTELLFLRLTFLRLFSQNFLPKKHRLAGESREMSILSSFQR